jgi:hypothetical protein
MSKGIRFGEGLNIVPIEGPADCAADCVSEWVELENAHWITFMVITGNMGTSDTVNVYVHSTTHATSGTTNANDYALPFKYRLSSAVGYNALGTITAVTTATGYVQLSDDDDNKILLIDVDPSDVSSHDSDAQYVYLTFDVTDASATDGATIVGAVAFVEDRYPQNVMESSTA